MAKWSSVHFYELSGCEFEFRSCHLCGKLEANHILGATQLATLSARN